MGKLLGNRYRVIDRLGEGGMATVYVARDEKLDRLVAVKVLHKHLTGNPEIRHRFRQEAKAISTLDHPNILKIYDYSGQESKRLWIVSEIIKGYPLSKFVEKFSNNTLHEIIACSVIREVCKALHVAHSRGLIHRDIKPENIMISHQGHIKLMDFGIAKDLQDSSMTVTGSFMGSPSYMSPEQVLGEDIDYRADIYSLGIMFYEIVTAKMPYEGKSTHDLTRKILAGKFIEPKFIRSDLNETINQLITSCISKEVHQRPDKASSVGNQLDQFLAMNGFVESHVELERYFKDRITYEARLKLYSTSNQSTILDSKLTEHSIDKSKITAENFASRKIETNYNAQKNKSKKTQHLNNNQSVVKKNQLRQQQAYYRNKQIALKRAQINKASKAKKQTILAIMAAQNKQNRAKAIYQQQRKNNSSSWLPYIISTAIALIIFGFFVIKNHPNKIKQWQPEINRNQFEGSNKTDKPIYYDKSSQTTSRQPKERIKKEVVKDIITNNSSRNKKPDATRNKKPNTVSKLKRYILPRLKPKRDPAQNNRIAIRPDENRQTPSVQKPVKEIAIKRSITPKKNSSSIAKAPIEVKEIIKKVTKPQKPALKESIFQQAYIKLSSSPAAQIYLNNNLVGTTVDATNSSQWIKTTNKNSKIELRRNGYLSKKLNFNLKSGQRLVANKVFLSKNSQSSNSKQMFFLDIIVNELPVELYIQSTSKASGKYFEMSYRKKSIKLPKGEYFVKISHEGQIKQRTINFSNGDNRRLTYRAIFKPSSIVNGE